MEHPRVSMSSGFAWIWIISDELTRALFLQVLTYKSSRDLCILKLQHEQRREELLMLCFPVSKQTWGLIMKNGAFCFRCLAQAWLGKEGTETCNWRELAVFLLVFSERIPKLASLSVWGDRKHELIFHLRVKLALLCQARAQGSFAVPPPEIFHQLQ